MNNNKKLLSFFYFVQEKCKFDDQNHLLNFIVRSISKWHRLHVAHKLNCLFPYYKLKMVAFVKKPSGWLLVRHFSQELLLLTYLLEKGDLKLPRNCHPYCTVHIKLNYYIGGQTTPSPPFWESTWFVNNPKAITSLNQVRKSWKVCTEKN